ncbi:MAG: ComEC/Rec2 family competence protein [Patescibacteria group bacterium]|nr:ComEC/Rec2 family competence protein [Patescibacteria group bacterium]
MRRTLVTAVLGGFFLGILLRSVADFGLVFVWFTLLLGGVLGAWGYLDVSRSRARSVSATRAFTPALFAALFFIALSLGILRTHAAIAKPLDSLLAAHIGEHVRVSGLIVAEPDERESSTRLTVRLEKLDGGSGAPLPVRGNALVVAPSFQKLSYGDRLEIEGELQQPKNFESGTGRVFDYASYLAKDGIRFEIKRAKVELLFHGGGSTLVGALLALKSAFLERVSRLIPEPHASLLGGLILGARRSLGENLLDRFRAVGLIHVVVLSGYNISIVADAVRRFSLLVLPRRFTWLVATLCIVLFALMTGGSATVVRASAMAVIAILARATDRVYDMTRALIFAGVAMTLHNPLILLFDPSFQLSFLATLALILLAPRITPHLTLIPERFKLREIATATIATQIFVLPLLLFESGQLSVVSLPANLLVLLAVPATMLLGFLAGVVGLVSMVLATPFAWLATALLGYMLTVTSMFSSLPFASIALPPLPVYGVVLSYGCISAALMWFSRRKQQAH